MNSIRCIINFYWKLLILFTLWLQTSNFQTNRFFSFDFPYLVDFVVKKVIKMTNNISTMLMWPMGSNPWKVRFLQENWNYIFIWNFVPKIIFFVMYKYNDKYNLINLSPIPAITELSNALRIKKLLTGAQTASNASPNPGTAKDIIPIASIVIAAIKSRNALTPSLIGGELFPSCCIFYKYFIHNKKYQCHNMLRKFIYASYQNKPIRADKI